MIVIVSQRSIDLSQRQVIIGGDFIGTVSQPFVPYDNILHSNTVACDMGFTANHPWDNFDMLI